MVLVTGSTDGIGKEAAKRLAGMGASVLVHGRSRDRGEAALEGIRSETGGGDLELVVGDLSSLSGVRSLAEQAREARGGRLDVLVNNAGVVAKERTTTEDGNELTFAVNHLAPFLLTNLLLDLLEGNAPSRVVTVTSELHERAALDFDDPQLERGWSPKKAYNRSKLAGLVFAYELARRTKGAGITSNALHPGVVGTKLLREGFGSKGSPVKNGAEGLVYLAASEEVEGVTGEYFRKTQRADSSPASYDEEAGKRLWELSERLCGL